MHYYSNIIAIIYLILIITWEWVWQSADGIDGKTKKMHVGAHTEGVMYAKSPRVRISSLGQS